MQLVAGNYNYIWCAFLRSHIKFSLSKTLTLIDFSSRMPMMPVAQFSSVKGGKNCQEIVLICIIICDMGMPSEMFKN